MEAHHHKTNNPPTPPTTHPDEHTQTHIQSGPSSPPPDKPQTRRTDGQQCQRRRQRGEKKKREMQLSVRRLFFCFFLIKQEQRQLQSVLSHSKVPGGHTTFRFSSHLFQTNPSFPTKLERKSQRSLPLPNNSFFQISKLLFRLPSPQGRRSGTQLGRCVTGKRSESTKKETGGGAKLRHISYCLMQYLC